jgi:NADP-dependent 3-hydroxy acid dehydrogenase YdfG
LNRRKVCIVTGASSGIGESLAKRLATVGAHVVISSRSVNKLEELVAFCHATAPGAKLLPVELDLEKFDKIDEYMERVLRALADGGLPSRIDVLFNNAGVSSRGLAINTDMSTLQRMMVRSIIVLHTLLYLITLLLKKASTFRNNMYIRFFLRPSISWDRLR